VNESVELVKAARKRSAAGFVNAVLRKVTREPVDWPSRSVALSQPEWLLRRWEAQFGSQVTDAIANAFLREPETYVRNPPPGTAAALEPAEVPGAFRLTGGSAAGLRIQDIGSQSIVPLLDLRPGETFLDLCAAPGNKTAQALESGVQAVACDLHLHRLRSVSGCARVVLDASQSLPFAGRFKKILIDAPCCGTGTLARNPEIRWRLSQDGIARLQEEQVAILHRGLETLAPGGRLVYSTCSLEREENEDVVTQASPHFRVRVLNELRRTPGVDAGDGFYAAVLTSE
jgi:16S rRNA (cytosine967-C5)-methyltransferase